MATVVVEQPDDIPYIGVSENNPFKKEQDRLSVDEPRPVYFGATLVHIPSNMIYRAAELEQVANTVKFVSFFDAVLAFTNFLIVGYAPVLIAVMFNYLGYLGACYFNKKMLGSYCVFQVFNFTSKIVYIIVKPDEHIGTILAISSLFNMMMVALTVKFIRLIPA